MSQKRLGVMVDCSRNAVMKVDAVKKFIDALSKMGYNMLMLYTEETYEVDNQPWFGYLRGRYSKDEMKEIVAYGEEKGIELIPCIQTLAHLNQMFRWPEYSAVLDCDDILLIDEEKTYRLIEDMFSTLRECFKTNKLHIGMDEAHNVGLGKFLDKHGFSNRFEIIARHLKRVADLAAKYDFEPMMWSDMFFRLANHGAYYVKDPDIITEDIVKCVPDNVELVYWDYYQKVREPYDIMIEAHKRFNKPVWFAGGSWTWTGFTPHNNMSNIITKSAMSACRDAGVDNVFLTCWGDNGGECSTFAVLPALFYAAEVYRGNDDMDSIKQRFEELFNFSYDDYMKLDLPSAYGHAAEKSAQLPDKQMLYSDPFLGFSDTIVDDSQKMKETYLAYAKELWPFANHETYGHLFKSAAALCEAVAYKGGLGKLTREAYKSGDKEALREVVKEYLVAEAKVNAFHRAHEECWFKEKKPHGFDLQDARLGGVIKRLESCRERLEAYIKGDIDRIEELEEELLNYPTDEYRLNNYAKLISANAF